MEAAQTTTSTPVAQTETGSPNAQSFTPSATTTEIKVSPNGMESEWYKSFNDDLKGYVQNKGFKDPQSVVESYKNFEKLMGAPKDRLLKLPEKADAPEWNEVYTKLGRPSDPKEYDFKLPEGSDPVFDSWARENFHKLGLTKTQAETLMKGYTELNTKLGTDMNDKMQMQIKEQELNLKKEWGAAFDQNVQVAKKAAAQFGLDGKAIDNLETALGYDGVMKFLQNIGSKIGESSFVGSNSIQGFGGVSTPEQARYQIAELKKDSNFISKWQAGDAESRNKLTQLHKWAYPE